MTATGTRLMVSDNTMTPAERAREAAEEQRALDHSFIDEDDHTGELRLVYH
jgi:hypothetical protein